jgi:hypothetical protein
VLPFEFGTADFCGALPILSRFMLLPPTGIATDDTCKKFFGDLIQRKNLVSLHDFENRGHLFTALHTKTKFCILNISICENLEISFSFMSRKVNDLNDKRKLMNLSPEDINLIN